MGPKIEELDVKPITDEAQTGSHLFGKIGVNSIKVITQMNL